MNTPKFIKQKKSEIKAGTWFFWVGIYIFLFLLFLFNTRDHINLISKIIVILIISFITAKIRIQKDLPVVSVIIVLVTGSFIAAVLNTTPTQFWVFLILYIAGHYISQELFEKKYITLWDD